MVVGWRLFQQGTVVAVDRQGVHLANPPPETVLFPNDTLLLVGHEEDLREAEEWLNAMPEEAAREECEMGGLGLVQLSVPLLSRHAGKPFAELGLASQWGIQVVGIDRGGRTRVGPGRSETLEPGDRLLLLGRPDRVRELAFWLST